jgi:CAAX prenyl protease-like protein
MRDYRAHHASARSAWYRVAPFAVYVSFMVLADMLGRLGWSAATLQWLYPAKIAAVAALLWLFRRAYRELRWHRMPGRRDRLVAVAAGALVFAAWIGLDADWMVSEAPGGYHSPGPDRLDWALVVVRFAGAVIMVPLMEELFWRAFLLRRLARANFLQVKPAAARHCACVVTAVLFAVEHNEWLAGLLAGAAFNFLFFRSRTLWSPVIAHAVANALLGLWVITTDNWKYW